MQALVVQPDGQYEKRELSGTIEEVQDIVGGWVEAVRSPFRPGVIALVNEDGRMKHLPRNSVASTVLMVGMVGPVVLVGDVGGPDFGDVPQHIVTWTENLTGGAL